MGRAAAYEPRHPEHSLLYSVIAEHLETGLLFRPASVAWRPAGRTRPSGSGFRGAATLAEPPMVSFAST
jgi:hypothetical protein